MCWLQIKLLTLNGIWSTLFSYLHGDKEKYSFLKQVTRWDLITSCFRFCLLGLWPIASATYTKGYSINTTILSPFLFSALHHFHCWQLTIACKALLNGGQGILIKMAKHGVVDFNSVTIWVYSGCYYPMPATMICILFDRVVVVRL